MIGTLYIVATPIGNLADITLRALKTLKEADLILAEDTRITSKLTTHYQIPAPIMSYHQHSDEGKKNEILLALLSGKNLALVSDAGTPGISDPGNELIDFLLTQEPGIKIVPIPGPAAITAALSASGLRTNKFVFIGFLPKKKRTKLFKWLKEGPAASSGRTITFAFYESPNRILKTLNVLAEYFGGDRRVFIARELTKIYETLYRGKLLEVKGQLEKEKVRGEMVVVVEL